ANSLPEAMNEIKKDFGKEAVILQTKEFKEKRMLGLFHKKKIEVIAAKDSQPVRESKRKEVVRRPSIHPVVPMESSLKKNFDSEKTSIQEIRSLKKLMELEKTTKGHDVPFEFQPAF